MSFGKSFLWGSRNHDSLIVERLWNYPSVGQSKNSSGLLITRIFNPRGIARISNAVALINIACCIPPTITICSG